MKLIYENTKAVVQIGDEVVSFRGERAKVVGWALPHHAGSTGRVEVQEGRASSTAMYFPSVYGLKFVEA